MDVPEIDLTDPAVLHDPYTAYAQVRERSAVVRLLMPGFGPFWAVTRHAEARAVLADPRMLINESSFMRPDVPEHCLPYMRTMSETNGAEHARLRRLVAPAFTPRRAGEFGARIERIVEGLLDELPEREPVDLLERFAKPLPIDVICELVGIPPADRPRWRSTAPPSPRATGRGSRGPSRRSSATPGRRSPGPGRSRATACCPTSPASWRRAATGSSTTSWSPWCGCSSWPARPRPTSSRTPSPSCSPIPTSSPRCVPTPACCRAPWTSWPAGARRSR
ncbi:hypothetical protein ACFQQB_64160 [Nonomuraea rubra]|uniref:hypothetical protein n=1 Tax=Nonomuraea rubra TaxID=46180 RepID=UPI003611F3A4